MADSHPEGTSTESRLQEFLVEAFPGRSATVSSATGAPHPLLLLRVRHDLAGFAVANGDPRHSFQDSYSYFKRLYTDRQQEWDNLNLIFVLCLRRRDRDLESFCASVETDVFFCRKFTIALDAPWDKEFARLPFFPLEHRANASIRPPSAQALLKGSGVPSTLAAAIVGRVGEDTIVQGCLSGRYGTPGVIGSGVEAGRDALIDRAQGVRVRLLEIENFRAYRRPQAFDIDADLTVLYGPNGFGKTSFFDAIDFAATGDIGRLGLGGKEDRFVKAARHLDAGPKEGSVTLTVRGEDGIHRIRRLVDQRRQAEVDREVVDRKEALSRLTNPQQPIAIDHIEHLVRLFRATHLFSQEFQELTEEFRQHCRLSTDVVSRMLTFEDYVNARRKVERVIDVLGKRMAARDSRIADLTEQLSQSRLEVGDLQENERSGESPQTVVLLRERLRQSIHSAGMLTGMETDPVTEARGWRAALEAEIEQARSLALRFTGLGEQESRIGPGRLQVPTLTGEVVGKQKELHDTSAQLAQARERQSTAEARLEGLIEREKTLRQRIQALAWHRENKPAYDALMSRTNGLTAEIGMLNQQLVDGTSPLERFVKEVGEAEAQVANTGNSVEASRRRLRRLADLLRRYPEEQQRVATLQALRERLTQVETILGGLAPRLQSAMTELSSAKAEERRVATELASITKSQSELQSLVAALEAHVTDAECPACGVRHESSDELLRRLRERRNASPRSSDVSSRLQDIRRRIVTLNAQIQELTGSRTTAQNTLGGVAGERDALEGQLAGFEADMREVGADPGDANAAARLREQIGNLERTTGELVQLSQRRHEAAEAARNQLTGLRADIALRQQEIAAKTQALRDAARQLDRLRREAGRFEVSIESDLKQVAAEERDTRRHTDEVTGQVSEVRRELSSLAGVRGELQRREQTLKQEVEASGARLTALRMRIAKYEGDLQALGLESGAAQGDISELASRATERASMLEQIKQEVGGLELALDAAARSAALDKLAASIRVADQELATLREDQEKEAPWREYFGRVQEKLERTQERGVSSYTREYGPLTSIIQQRLRSVSGFDEVSLHPEGDRIEVRVARNREQLPPTDFFSQSQQQILILSLFITACISQTWSAFSPILLDDPVTHFDDLNAYSFLDLMSGLLETERQGRQFILSTCDERLFLLARQRFKHFGDRAKVYRFVTCGRDGPVVERM